MIGIDIFCLWFVDIKNGGIKNKMMQKIRKKDEGLSISPSPRRAQRAACAKCENWYLH